MNIFYNLEKSPLASHNEDKQIIEEKQPTKWDKVKGGLKGGLGCLMFAGIFVIPVLLVIYGEDIWNFLNDITFGAFAGTLAIVEIVAGLLVVSAFCYGCYEFAKRKTNSKAKIIGYTILTAIVVIAIIILIIVIFGSTADIHSAQFEHRPDRY